ncbi:Protein C07D8.6 [Aphelenchoides avenae]|nr:Protein C07D8.6 [Aphelenchus avenae]
MTSITLSNGVKMPIVGLGTWQSNPGEVEKAVTVALDAGYRQIDTAAVYANEEEIGKALSEYLASGKLKREDVFITTKAWCSHLRKGDLEEQLREQLKKLRTDYVDLYLAHMPVAFKKDMSEQDPSVKVEDIWQALEDVYNKGLVKAIGVSNWNVSQMERALKIAKVPIHNNQVELHLHFAQFELHDFCRRHNISVTAYAPLGSPGRSNFKLPSGQKLTWPEGPEPLKNPLVVKLAEKYKKTPAQILLRHLIQRDICVIPKSINPERIHENFQVFDFELSKNEVDELNKAPQHGRLFLQDHIIGHPEDPFADERDK